ncbi:MAG: septum site-determining protein MinD [Oscillospiraceae bacterium]|nr:septum site-determining protein MinD [Oscillospiraceae bacterium]
MGKVITLASGKGGTGKSTLAAGIASYLAALGKRVLAVDADIGLRSLDVLLGMHESMAFDFNDVIERRCTLNDAVTAHPVLKRLSLLAAPNTIMPQEIDLNVFQAMMKPLRPHFDYILVDSAAGVDTAFQLAVSVADMVIVVANTELISLRDAARVHQLLLAEAEGQKQCRLVVNRVRPHQIVAGEAANIDEVMDMVGLPLLGLVPEDETVIACANHASPLILQGRTNAGQAMLDIARRIDGLYVPLPKKIRASASQFVEVK